MSSPHGGDERPHRLTIGSLPRVHGVRGELKLKASTEHVAILRRLADEAESITLRSPWSGDEWEVTFAHVRGADSAPIVKLDGVDGRDAAEEFRGAEVLVDRAHLPEPDPDEYFLADLEGCTALDADTGQQVGRVIRAELLPANIVLTVRMDQGGAKLLVPFADVAVPEVDVTARTVTVDLEYLGVDETGAERE